MLSTDFKESRVDLEKSINRHLDFIISNVDFEKGDIIIHLNSGRNVKDFGRSFFILFVLSRIFKNNLSEKLSKSDLLSLHNKLLVQAKAGNIGSEMYYVQVYSMRFLLNLGENIDKEVNDFANSHDGFLYSRPVLMYIFLSLVSENKILLEQNQYLEELYFQSLKTFEYILASNKKESMPLFYFSELNVWGDDLNINFANLGKKYISENLEKYLNDENSSSSGIAKVLEYYGRAGDYLSIVKVCNALEKRNYNNFNFFHNPVIQKYKNIFTEYPDSQYIMLDTTGHIVNSLLNLYESLYARKN